MRTARAPHPRDWPDGPVRDAVPYAARFALLLTVRDGLVVRHLVHEDSLAVALTAGAAVPA